MIAVLLSLSILQMVHSPPPTGSSDLLRSAEKNVVAFSCAEVCVMSRSIPFVAVVTGDRLLQIDLLDMLVRDRRVHSCRSGHLVHHRKCWNGWLIHHTGCRRYLIDVMFGWLGMLQLWH